MAAVKIKTHRVLMVDGREGRGVKLTKNNQHNVALWTGGEDRIVTKKDKLKAVYFIRTVKLKTKKGFRVAEVDDIVVKFLDGSFEVIKSSEFAKYVLI